ncbi:MAG: endonuclease MutS2 [Vicinamibacteria bacterium]
MNANTFRILEFESIRSLLVARAGSANGKSRLRALRPLREPSEVRRALVRTTEAAAVLAAVGRQPHHDLPDLAEILPAARVSGLHLEPAALLDVASFIEGGALIARCVASVGAAPGLAQRASRIVLRSDLAAAIRRAILPSREVADDASPRLLETRRAIARVKTQLQSLMESFLRGKDAERILQDRLVTTRNDRCVLLLKAEHRGQLPGIVHGSSGSGASLFVEPMPAVELNNDIMALGDLERAEVVRILKTLTALVRDQTADLANAADALGELDAAQAMALLARDTDAVEPEITDGLEIDCIDARHPLLMGSLAEELGAPRRSRREPVPVSLRVGFGDPVLVISGPNTGGKTVALKTLGLLALMAQSGLHIPVGAGSRLPVFRCLYADIGDDQSIAESLSTFSAHLASIVEMTHDLEAPALVLLDEVGAGTDPTEGGGLGVAIVDHFKSRGAMVVATTHHGLMKAYAQSTPGVSCASFGYDPSTYEPTYRLALGVPGRSLALEMAEKLGLPADVVADARARVDAKEAQAEALLKRLEEDRANLAREVLVFGEKRQALKAAQEELRAAEAELARRRRAEGEAFSKELRRRGEEAARKAADAIGQAVKRVETSRRSATNEGARARTEAVRQIRIAQDEALRDVAPVPAEADAGGEVRVGDRARVRSLGVIGEVLSIGGPGDVELAVGGKRMRVPRAEIISLGATKPSSSAAVSLSPRPRVQEEGPTAEINLVGLTVDEALPRVDKFLDDAAVSERREVRVIHGFGQGRLRKAVAGLLDGHPHVAAFRLGEGREGGAGATIVELKD